MPDAPELQKVVWRAAVFAGCAYLLWLNLYLVLLVVIALIIAAALLPVAEAAQKRRIPRIVTVATIYVFGLGVLTLLIALLVPVLVTQGRMVVTNLQAYQGKMRILIDRALAYVGRFEWIGDHAVPSLGVEQIGPFLQELAQRSYTATRGALSGALGVFLVLFVAAYIVIDARRIAAGLLAFVPPGRRERVTHLGGLVLSRMGGYVRGQTTVSLFVGGFISAGLAIMGFDSALLVGLVAGVFNLVPYLGTALALLLAILLALNVSLWAVAWVLALFAVEQFIEGNFVSPYFLGRQLDLHPLAVMGALAVGANLAGVLGAMVAVPLVAGLNAMAQEICVKPARR